MITIAITWVHGAPPLRGKYMLALTNGQVVEAIAKTVGGNFIISSSSGSRTYLPSEILYHTPWPDHPVI